MAAAHFSLLAIGLICQVGGEVVTVGSLAWLKENGVESPSSLAQVGVGFKG